MTAIVAACFLTPILALLSTRLQSAFRKTLAAHPAWVFLAPAILSALFCAIATAAQAFSASLAVLILVYTFVPTATAFVGRSPGTAGDALVGSCANQTCRTKGSGADEGVRPTRPSAIDFAIILWFWLPLEFSIGAAWIPRPQQALLHIAAYGIAVTLALILFLLFRRLDGMKYNLPRSSLDLRNLLIGFAIGAPILIAVGRAVGFIDSFHLPQRLSVAHLAVEYAIILAATALPEELLFRALIQNSLIQRFGPQFSTLVLAGLIFGCAHLDNGPGPLPNWRYMIVATIAGVIYGKVFQRSSSIFASAGLHALVNTIKHNFF